MLSGRANDAIQTDHISQKWDFQILLPQLTHQITLVFHKRFDAIHRSELIQQASDMLLQLAIYGNTKNAVQIPLAILATVL